MTNNKIDYHSSENQRIVSKLVEREVYCLVNNLMENIIENNFDNFIDCCDNYYASTVNGEVYSELQIEETRSQLEENILCLEGEIDQLEVCGDSDNENEQDLTDQINKLNDEKTLLEDELYDYENPDSELQEVYQWFAVSDWIADKLITYGEVVYDDGCTKVWGRGGCGQAIHLDYIWCKIAEDMEILEGQQFSWKDK